MLSVPYVSAASFRAYPSYMDTDGLNLPSLDDPAMQSGELTNRLLAASEWADSEVDYTLGAQLHVQRERVDCGRDGTLTIHAEHRPVLQVTSVGYGYTSGALTTLDSPTAWIEGDVNMVISLSTQGTTPWSGSLQFGSPVLAGRIFAQALYVAGHPATVLQFGAEAADTTLTVLDPTGIVPGERYRLYGGRDETVVVDPAWIPPVPSTSPLPATVVLQQPLRYDHEPDEEFSGMPGDVRLAIVQHTMSQLLKPDSPAEDEYPDNATSTTRTDDSRPKGVGLLAAARRTLASYARVR
ncbi:hypothetical protein AB0912_15720 [Streptomyces sp. NPDC007084]|uniref:hypothetical protein n=1 Tax=Streptomyces sp. NPDC007084 TaxID=3154313 RepID=UPI0034526678